MKKTLLAAALAVGFASAASAQTSVTLYGVVDGGLGYTQFKHKNAPQGATGTATRTGGYGGNHTGNQWGLIGSEDLGNGLKAFFQLENGFDLFTGNLSATNRLFGVAKLGLSNDAWGSVSFGRRPNIADAWVPGVIGPYGADFAEGRITATFTSAAVGYNNMLTYETPLFSGFQLGLGYSFHADGNQPYDRTGQPDDDRTAWSAAARYTNGPLAMVASYDIVNKVENSTETADVKAWILGASYDFDVVKLHVGVGQHRNGVLGGRGVPNAGFANVVGQDGFVDKGYKTNNYALGVRVPLDNSWVAFGWQSSRLGSGTYKNQRIAAGGKNSQNLFSVVYTYDLSKRTNLYAFGTHGTGYAFNNVNVTQAIVGLRHRF